MHRVRSWVALGASKQQRLETAGRQLRLAAARVLSSTPVGVVVGGILRHRVPNRGVRFATAGMPAAVNGALLFGIYEGAEVRFVQKHFGGQSTIVDLGGSLGIVAGHALHVADDRAKLLSVEARQDLLPVLRSTIADHTKPGQTASIVHAAISDTERPVRFAVAARPDSGRITSATGAGTVAVPGLRLSSFLAEQGVDDFALISDIEGAERHLLWGDETALAGCHLALFELHGSSQEVRRMIERLAGLGLPVIDQRGPVVVARR